MCEHKFVHLETIKYKKDHYPSYCQTYTKIDRFFCEKCLEIKELKQEVCQQIKPDWFY